MRIICMYIHTDKYIMECRLYLSARFLPLCASLTRPANAERGSLPGNVSKHLCCTETAVRFNDRQTLAHIPS